MQKLSSKTLEGLSLLAGNDLRYGRSVERAVNEIVRIKRDGSIWFSLVTHEEENEVIGFGVIVCDKSRIDGWASFLSDEEVVFGDPKYVAELLYVYVKSGKRKKGVGGKIVADCLDHAWKSGYKNVWALVSDTDVGVVDFYRKNNGSVLADFSDHDEGHVAVLMEWKGKN